MNKNYWKNGVNEILKHVINGKRTMQEAKGYMESNYVGETRKAFKHMAWEATSSDQTNELAAYNLIRDVIKLGGGKDLSFENSLR